MFTLTDTRVFGNITALASKCHKPELSIIITLKDMALENTSTCEKKLSPKNYTVGHSVNVEF